MNTSVLHSSNGRNKCYIKTNKFYQIGAFHGEVNTIRHFAKNVLKTCVSSPLFYKYHLSTFYTCLIYEILIILTDIEKFDLSLNFVINFCFVNFFLKIYRNFSLL